MLINEVPSQKPRITVYLPQQVKEKFDRLAELNDRSASAFALHLIEKSIWEAEKNGIDLSGAKAGMDDYER